MATPPRSSDSTARDPRTGRTDIRPLSARTTRILVVLFLVFCAAVAFWMATVVIDGARDPATQERIEQMERGEVPSGSTE